MNNQNFLPREAESRPEMTGEGYIIINVTTARGAIPLAGALVRIFDFENGTGNALITTAKTNSSGRTERIALPAPPRASSLTPKNGKAYSTYNIDAQLDGYYNQQYINVPIFEGVTAIQSIDLVPLAENGRENTLNSIFYENENSSLEQP